ncbi:MAG: 3-ketoacyl-ACP reductase [Enterococcaceae bacterium]|jgi:NAD(P)-dependent dehydrogenase (short-subunit alcohol dehydrogenase family)|nr:3-ketoacyl-ACP reductase [Enterococcaceae bacterium]MCI1918678.1 3-ketoacyl-ACP reductase [Enterococcaceae bacterium]
MKKIAIVTGGRRGIGLGISKALLKEGYFVVMSAHSLAAAEAEEELSKIGKDFTYIQCDVSNTADRLHLIDEVEEKYGRIDLLVNDAGVAPKQRLDILETTEDSYDYVVNTNARSTFFMCQLVANRMIKAKEAAQAEDYEPRIVNISSMSAYTSSTSRGEYCISKAAISMTTKLFADRLAAFDIPVFEVRPGIIATDMTSVVHEKYEKMIAEGLTPIKRFGQPEDVANCVLAAVSGLLDFATGQVLNADGGFHIRRL